MGECVVLFADEAFYAGDRAHESILKTLVTEKTWLIERKGIDATRSPSCLHVIMSSNADWVVPTDADDRRYCVIDCGDAHMRDQDYFTAISSQMQNGGYEALLHYLLNVDLADFNAEAFPRTKEHDRQRALSLRGLDSLISTMCHEGRLPCSQRNRANVTVTTGEEERRGFYHYARSTIPDLKWKSGQVIGNLLKAEPWNCKPWKIGYERGIEFPPLAELRAAFAEKHGPQQWQHDVADWTPNDDNIPF
jgi:hypothetical protein